MPLYDCKCPNCGRVAEQLLKRDDEPNKCPACLTVMERLSMQLPNFALKGGGWFADGYSKGKAG